MMERRAFVGAGAAMAVGGLAGCRTTMNTAGGKRYQRGASRWPICLDTATLAGSIPLAEKVELAAAAGFDAIEPWDKELKKHQEDGGNLKDLGARIRELGMFVPSVIGLWGALAPDKETFEKELDAHKERLDMVAAIGSEHVQVIPKFRREEPLDPDAASWAYGRVCELGRERGLKPAVIFLNFVPGLERLSDAARIALRSGQREAKIIPDTYHMFLGGTSPDSLYHLDPDFIAIFQFADAGQDVVPSNAYGLDGKRVLPGDGKLPLVDYLRPLREIGYTGCISLELYNPEYRKREPGPFLAEALRKTVAVAAAAG